MQVQVTLADCGAEGRGLVASGDIRQGEQILQVCTQSGCTTQDLKQNVCKPLSTQVPDSMLLTRERCLELSRLGSKMAAADLPTWTVLAAFLVDVSDQVCNLSCSAVLPSVLQPPRQMRSSGR